MEVVPPVTTILYIYISYFSVKKMSLLTSVYGHVGHHILHKEEENRERNTALEYDPKPLGHTGGSRHWGRVRPLLA